MGLSVLGGGRGGGGQGSVFTWECTCTPTHAPLHACVHTCANTNTCTHVHAHANTRLCAHMGERRHTRKCANALACTPAPCTRRHTNALSCAHSCSQSCAQPLAHMHTSTQGLARPQTSPRVCNLPHSKSVPLLPLPAPMELWVLWGSTGHCGALWGSTEPYGAI